MAPKCPYPPLQCVRFVLYNAQEPQRFSHFILLLLERCHFFDDTSHTLLHGLSGTLGLQGMSPPRGITPLAGKEARGAKGHAELAAALQAIRSTQKEAPLCNLDLLQGFCFKT